jgi:hypothetical protein
MPEVCALIRLPLWQDQGRLWQRAATGDQRQMLAAALQARFARAA